MMQETGSKISFDTARTVLVPVDIYERGGEEELLRFNGMALAAGEVAVVSEPQDGIVAVMVVSADEWNLYKDRYERGEVIVASPLLTVATGRGQKRARGRFVDILMTSENVYFAVWERGLKMAEVLPDNSVDSILYYLQVVGRRFKLGKFYINVAGEKAGFVVDTMRRYYGRVKLVSEM